MVKGFRGLAYEERLNALKILLLNKRRPRNDFVLTNKILYSKTDPEAMRLFKFSKPPGLRGSFLRLLYQIGRRIMFTCRVVKRWNHLSLAD